jgi:hypothetical protein
LNVAAIPPLLSGLIMKRRLKRAFLSGMTVFLLVSCGDVVMSNYGKDGGNLLIRFPGAAGDHSAARSAIPGAGTQALLEYRITLTDGSQTLSAVVPAGETSTVLSVTPGVWDIKAEAYLPPGTYAGNDFPVHVGSGSAQVSVAEGQNAGAEIKLIFDNTTPASVEVSYLGTTYDAEYIGDNTYSALLTDYDPTQSAQVTINKAVDDQVILNVNNTEITGPVSLLSPTDRGQTYHVPFTVNANDLEGFSAPYTVDLIFGWPVDTTASAMDLKTRFSITTTGVNGVTEAFNAVSWLINTPEAGDFADIIQLGDWIDLPAPGFMVAPYNSDGAISPTSPTPIMAVGINSFNGKNGNNTPHVVFQFKNVPGTRRMNQTADGNTGGYAASEMRAYLVPSNITGTGTFYAGLTAAGVPDAVVWAPSRRVANGGSGASGADTIADKLWLPTEFEIGNGGTSYSSTTWEIPANQAYLEYYTNDSLRIKYDSSNTAVGYWDASPKATDAANFCIVGIDGTPNNALASSSGGVAPAFCVK